MTTMNLPASSFTDSPIPMISVRKANFFYGDIHILKNITFNVPVGGVTAILGASASGKTTLLRTLIGLNQLRGGEIWIKGQNLNELSEARHQRIWKQMAIVFQHGALFDSLTAWENVGFPLYERRSLPMSEIRKEAERLLEMVDLQGAADLTIDQCSGGMQMRIAIARAFASSPEIILYDEPTSGLDPIARDLICDLIQKQQIQQKVTSVLVTHQLSTAFRVSNSFIFLHAGEVIFEGDADELMGSKDPYIQRFIQPPSRAYRTVNPEHL
ncbi:MAG: ATP-binding cassette domain-containing protein [Candidatus Poribacteria bacterium]|nr:ATP-binding cassette domain-containing protein [Candidatus Poribacteria bacterium]